MTGLEKIINKIDSDNTVRCEQIISSAEKKAEALKLSAKADAEKKAGEIINAANEKKQKIMSVQKSGNEQLKKQMILNAKIDLINSVINASSKKLDSFSDSDYFEFLLKLISKYAVEGECVFLANSEDNARMPDSFRSSAAAVAEKKGARISFTDESINIKNGFILRYGLIEINCSFDSIIDENREDLKEKVNSILF